ncbi:MAG: DUF192 domain-containing protein [Phycisphaerales bacterium]
MASPTRALNLSSLRGFMMLLVASMASIALVGCDEKTSSDVATVKIKGQTFHLEIAADPDKRYLGLGKRKTIEDDGGMIFVFPPADIRVQSFLMRDCETDIDIIYLDGSGRVLSMHHMPKEPPRNTETEKADDPKMDEAYHARLPKYSSRFPSQIVIELKGGKLEELTSKYGLKESDKVDLDVEALKKLAR